RPAPAHHVIDDNVSRGMAGSKRRYCPAMPLPHHVVAGPPIISTAGTRAICDRWATWSRRSQSRATRTSADPPSGRLAGLPADDPVLGDRLGGGHRAGQPAVAITE